MFLKHLRIIHHQVRNTTIVSENKMTFILGLLLCYFFISLNSTCSFSQVDTEADNLWKFTSGEKEIKIPVRYHIAVSLLTLSAITHFFEQWSLPYIQILHSMDSPSTQMKAILFYNTVHISKATCQVIRTHLLYIAHYCGNLWLNEKTRHLRHWSINHLILVIV